MCLRQEQLVWRPQVNSTSGKVEEVGGREEDSVFEARATCLETTGKLNQWEGRGREEGIMCLKQEQPVWRPQVMGREGRRDCVFEARATCLETTGELKPMGRWRREGEEDYVLEARATCLQTTGKLS